MRAQTSDYESLEQEARDFNKQGNNNKALEFFNKAGYVSVAKSYQNNRPLTTCSLTAPGRKAFAEYINLLEQIVRQTKNK